MELNSSKAYFNGVASPETGGPMAAIKKAAIAQVVGSLGADKAQEPKLEKAVLSTYNAEYTALNMITVQFNPAQYSISRASVISKKQSIAAGETDKIKSILSSEPAVLNLTLYFDSITDLSSTSASSSLAGMTSLSGAAAVGKSLFALGKSISSKANKSDVTGVTGSFIELMRYTHDTHSPNIVKFQWGSMKFVGRVTSNNVRYTMFLPSGIPVRAEMSLTIIGEENMFIEAALQQKFESPDRTKERTLVQGEQLWQLAYDEYDDASKWKVIAKTNDILNPRKITTATDVVLPAL